MELLLSCLLPQLPYVGRCRGRRRLELGRRGSRQKMLAWKRLGKEKLERRRLWRKRPRRRLNW
jgi:hypothetical protein